MKEQNQVDNDEANNNKQQRQHSFKKAAATARLCSAPRGSRARRARQRRRRRRAAELRNCAAPDLLARQRATASNACKLQQPRAHKATTARRAQLVSCGHGLRFRARAALAPLQQCVQLGRSGPRRRPWRASRGCCFRERRSGEPRTARSRRAALPRRTDGGWLETSPAGDGEVRLGARGQQPTSEREKPPRRGGGVALRRATESQRSGLLATTGDGRGVSSADRVDGISNTVHPWASFNRRMVDVRARSAAYLSYIREPWRPGWMDLDSSSGRHATAAHGAGNAVVTAAVTGVRRAWWRAGLRATGVVQWRSGDGGESPPRAGGVLCGGRLEVDAWQEEHEGWHLGLRNAADARR